MPQLHSLCPGIDVMAGPAAARGRDRLDAGCGAVRASRLFAVRIPGRAIDCPRPAEIAEPVAAAPLRHVEMEMRRMRGVAPRPEHRREITAGAFADRPLETAFGLSRAAAFDRHRIAVGEADGGDVE